MKITNKLGLPEALVNAVGYNTPHDAERVGITRLLRPPQINMIEAKHWEEIEEDVAERIFALFGSAVHYILEKAAQDNSLIEEKLTATVGDVTIVGKPDLLEGVATSDGHRLTDWKVTTLYQVKGDAPNPGWIDQLNAYAWLWAKSGFIVEQAEVVALLRDWSKSMWARTPAWKNYPRYPVVRINVTDYLVTRKEVENTISERVTLYQQALSGKAPACSDEETWARPTTWAVMKEGRKTALRVLSTVEEATEWIANNAQKVPVSITRRAGDCIRCRSYCSASTFCAQWKKWQEENGGEDIDD